MAASIVFVVFRVFNCVVRSFEVFRVFVVAHFSEKEDPAYSVHLTLIGAWKRLPSVEGADPPVKEA
jgi:hypothetical protein